MRDATKAADVRSLATAFGVVVEKAQLLDGGATERVEIMGRGISDLRADVLARYQGESGQRAARASPYQADIATAAAAMQQQPHQGPPPPLQ